jgi:allophanate hydrolase subunit 1
VLTIQILFKILLAQEEETMQGEVERYIREFKAGHTVGTREIAPEIRQLLVELTQTTLTLQDEADILELALNEIRGEITRIKSILKEFSEYINGEA